MMKTKPLTIALATGLLVAASSAVLAQGSMVNAYVPLPDGSAISSPSDVATRGYAHRAEGYAAYGSARGVPAGVRSHAGGRIEPAPVQPFYAPFQGR
jgi:hypothetical protein